MSFLWPIWLSAAAAVTVPVVIHLLSRGRGRTVSLGTVRFLPAAQSHRLRKIRPSGLLRMLLRAGLIASLAVALAGPRIWTAVPASPNESWLLVDPALLAERGRLEAAAGDDYRRLDGSTATERRLLAPGLPLWKGGEVEAPPASDLWSLVAEADRLAPPGAALTVFALDRAGSLTGERPVLGRSIDWWSVTDPQPNRWIQRAVRTDDGIDVTVGTSSAQGTRFSQASVVRASRADAAIRLDRDGGAETVQLTEGGSRASDDLATVPDGRPPLMVTIDAEDDRIADRAHVLSAASAVATHLGRPLALAAADDERVDLAIGLGRPADGPRAAVRVLDSEEGVPCHQSVFVPALADPWLALERCAESQQSVAHWRGAWGQPLLSIERLDSGPIWRWHGRFDPAWSDLTESGLPHLLLDLVAPGDESSNGAVEPMSDRRAGVAGHDRPASAERPAPLVPNRLPERIAWVLAIVLFVADRLLVRRAS